MRTKRHGYILVREEWGIYLGHCLGMGWFTLLDRVGQEEAVCFESVRDLEDHVESWHAENNIDDYCYILVEMDNRESVSLNFLAEQGFGFLLWKQ